MESINATQNGSTSPKMSPSKESRVHGVSGRMRLGKDLALPTTSSGDATDAGKSWMDVKRHNMAAYEYLCRIGEAKQWVEACIQEELPQITQLDEGLRNGVVLAKLARAFEPELVRKIFEDPKLQFRHSDNINYCFLFMKKVGLPPFFTFELTDLYDLKNFPKVVYSIHALSHLLAKKGIAPKIKNLVGKLDFTDAEVNAMQENLDKSGVALPSFGNVDKTLEKELAPEKSPEQLRQEYLAAHSAEIVQCQGLIRGFVARKRYQKLRAEHQELVKVKTPAAIAIQCVFRGHMVRKEMRALRASLKQSERGVVAFQAMVRGVIARKHFNARRNFYRKNEEAIVSIQSWLKSKRQHSAYSQLLSLENPPLPVVANFIHLLDVGAHDLEDELSLENLKQTAVKQIRENAALEQHLNELDIKIALLVKNRTTLDEVVKVSSKKLKKTLSDEEVRKAAQVFQLKSLDKQSRLRLEAYQTMFYMLQTNPMYLTRLLWSMRDWSSEVVRRLIETCVLTLFSYAQNAREEYLLLKLLNSAIELEIRDLQDMGDFVKSNPAFIKLVLQYVRGAKERQYLKSVLCGSIEHICACQADLELDPVQVYKMLIKEEESTTGHKSSKKYDVAKDDALKDEATVQRITSNYRTLEGFIQEFMDAITTSVGRMPYGIRYIAKQLYRSLQERFPKEKHSNILRIVGNLIYYRYINPALVAPDAFDVSNSPIGPLHRKNLSEISKIMNVIATGKALDSHLAFASEYVDKASQHFLKMLEQVINVPAPEVQLNIDIYSDAARVAKPVIYISPNEIFSMHATIHQHMDEVCPGKDDPLRKILMDLGAPPPFQQDKTGPEVSLTLLPTYEKAMEKDNDYDLRRLFVATKKQIVLIIRAHRGGSSLLDLLECPSTDEAEERFDMLQGEAAPMYTSMASLSGSATISRSHDGISSPVSSLAQLKVRALEAIARLEQAGLVSRKDKYQSMLSSIVNDIRNKHRRREQLQLEKASLEATMVTLMSKHGWLQDQEKSYQDYIATCMQQLTAHQGQTPKKWRSNLPFSRHSRHIRELERQRKAVPKFGSYKYTAKELIERGVVESIDVEHLSSRMYDKLDITLSSNEQGVFDIECAFNSLGVHITNERDSVKLEDLLSLQFENKAETKLFEGSVTVNVNLLIYFINKKFYA